MARTRGCLWLMAGAVVALLAGLVGYLTLSNATAQRDAPAGGLPEVQVVVAAQAVAVRSALTDKDVVLRSVPVNLAPEGALQETRAVVGKVAMTDLVPGEVILQQRLADPNVTVRQWPHRADDGGGRGADGVSRRRPVEQGGHPQSGRSHRSALLAAGAHRTAGWPACGRRAAVGRRRS